MKAIKVNENTAKVASGVDIPKVRPTYLLAKVDSIALNRKCIVGQTGSCGAPRRISRVQLMLTLLS